MNDRERRLKALEARLGAGDDAPCCRLTAAEYRAHLEAEISARENEQPEPPLYLLSGGCRRTGGDLCPEATAACALILDRQARVEENMRGLDETSL
jgi:hypothetical protein